MEDYSDFGSTFIVKLTSRYDFTDAFAICGTVSTGFRAPTLAEGFYSATNVAPTSAFVQLPPNSAAARLVGVNGLKPEKSRNYSVGFVVKPGAGITATLDLYQISIKDRIVGSGSLFGSGGDVNLPAVRAAIIANGNVLDATVTQTGINIFTNGLGTTSPKYRGVVGALWTFGDLQINLKETLYGPASRRDSRTGCFLATGASSPTCFKSTIKTTLITDLEVSYKILDAIKISVGANNLFNEYPDKLNPNYRQTFLAANVNGYVTQYPSFSSFGINGGYYYGKIAYTF